MYRCRANDLTAYAQSLFCAAGADNDKAEALACGLIEADLMGYSTHGFTLVPRYLPELQAGTMRGSGDVDLRGDRGACLSWDGRLLPGLWLVRKAIDEALLRVPQFGVVTVVVGRSHHTGALSAYLRRATDKGYLIFLTTSDPTLRRVAGHGGIDPVISQNPIGIGIPTEHEPILIDFSTSIISGGRALQAFHGGKTVDGPWLVDSDGHVTDRPAVLFSDAVKGAILPLGGLEYGFKGMGLGILVEALTGGLSGDGRAGPSTGWSSNFFLQLIDPDAFGGLEAFRSEMEVVSAAYRASRPIDPAAPVRLPGDRASANRTAALRDGVTISARVVEETVKWSKIWAPAILPPARI